MKKRFLLVFILASLCFLNFSYRTGGEQPSKIQVRLENGKYQLYRNNEPYFIKGAGGYKYYDRLKECGGNSVRLWSTEGAQEYLDQAHALGLTVTLGLDLGHERRGFNYSDPKAVKQ